MQYRCEKFAGETGEIISKTLINFRRPEGRTGILKKEKPSTLREIVSLLLHARKLHPFFIVTVAETKASGRAQARPCQGEATRAGVALVQ